MTSEDALGNAGYAITGSGGGGSGGNYVFANLAELDAIITQWAEMRDAIQADGVRLAQAQTLIRPPAHDTMSERQPAAVNRSLDKALAHNATMRAYASSYIEKLSAARERYLSDDDASAARMRAADAN